jgi:predicted transcriptional regulator
MNTISSGLVFFALSDATRREILELLHVRDGRRPVDLHGEFAMSRQAVLKHLHLLEDAGLITARRTPRETFYHLNRKTLRRLDAEWLAKFTRRATSPPE